MGQSSEILFVIFLLTLSALFSGLSLGFFTLRKNDLKRKAELGDKNAEKLYKIRKNGNLLLCTMIIGNITVNSVLSIFMGSLTSGVVASLVSILLIVLFGEIFPQALFARHALRLGPKFVWLVEIFIFIFYPVAKPLSVILDRLLGEELPTIYSKKELVSIIEAQSVEAGNTNTVDEDERRIMKGALSYSDKVAGDIMTPRAAMVSIRIDEELSAPTVEMLRESGHSRIPVYVGSADNIVGMLYVKDLLGHDLTGKKVGDVARRSVIFVSPKKPLDDLLNDFKRTRNHLFVVVDKYGSVLGLVTIEDVIEEIIGAEIVDEFDQYEDLQQQALSKLEKKTLL
jgi:metal transporter CNNM